jgi:Zn-dependent peptidase ImmA (M78 family)/predicted secreted protein
MLSWQRIHLLAAVEAARAHRELQIDTSRQIDPFSALTRTGIVVIRRPLIGLAGLYLPKQGGSPPGVILNASHPLSKQRYTAAHELAHHRRDGQVILDEDTEWMPRTVTAMNERERIAEAFSAWFLMPKRLVEQVLTQLRLDPRTIDPIGAYRLSLELGTSYQAAVHHLGDMRLLPSARRKELLAVTPREVKRRLGAAPALADSWRDVWIVQRDDNRADLSPAAGDAVLVEVQGAPSSGYLWQAARLPHGVALVSHDYQPAEPSAVGGRGTHRFLFRVSGSTSGLLTLEMRRPWEERESPAERLELGIRSAPKPAAGMLNPLQLAASA